MDALKEGRRYFMGWFLFIMAMMILTSCTVDNNKTKNSNGSTWTGITRTGWGGSSGSSGWFWGYMMGRSSSGLDSSSSRSNLSEPSVSTRSPSSSSVWGSRSSWFWG